MALELPYDKQKPTVGVFTPRKGEGASQHGVLFWDGQEWQAYVEAQSPQLMPAARAFETLHFQLEFEF